MQEPSCSPPASGSRSSEAIREDAKDRAKELFAQGLFAIAFAFNLFVVLRWAGQPLLDQHNFRQTQTAISTWWLAHDSGLAHWLNYQTPVFGAPWQIPLEFPLFQWLVAGAYLLTGLPLDPLGRCLSAVLFYATLWPLSMLVRDWGFPRRCFCLAASLLLVSPVYLYWSRAFLIESTALFLSFLFLAWLKRYLLSQNPSHALFATLAGILAVLTKVTTVLPFAGAAGLMILADGAARKTWRRPGSALRFYLPLLACALVCGVSLEAWLRHSAGLTASSYFGYILVPGKLHGWTYGTWAQRLSAQLWQETVWRRAVSEAVGSRLALLLFLFAGWRLGWRSCGLPLALLGLFVLPFLAFANLQIVHNYYQYANAVFLVLALALILWQLSLRCSFLAFALVCGLIVFGEVRTFVRTYLHSVREDYSGAPLLQTSEFIKEHTPPDSVLLVLGCDWNPTLAYYCQRRAVYVPPWATWDQIELLFKNPSLLTDGKPVSALLEFSDGFESSRTGMWQGFVRKLSAGSIVTRFGPYRAVLPRNAQVWTNTVLSASLPNERPAQELWADYLPPDWQLQLKRKEKAGELQNAWLGTKALANSGVPMSVMAGEVLRLRGRTPLPAATSIPPALILGLRGTNWCAARFSWAVSQTGPGPSSRTEEAEARNTTFDIQCHIPSGLPEDTYQAMLFQNDHGAAIPVNLGLKLHIESPWLEALPEGWPASTDTNAQGTVEGMKIGGQGIAPSQLAAVAKRATVIQLSGWLGVRAEPDPEPEVLLALSGPGATRYFHAQTCWRPDVSKARADTAFDFSGFNVSARLPSALPPGTYHLSLLRKCGGKSLQLGVPAALEVTP